ncbi:MAG: glycosyltransferase [bacterium]
MRVFYAVLDMGLGHATRSLPVIRALEEEGCRVTVGSAGSALSLLRRECPDRESVGLPPYALRYGRRGAGLPGLILQAPRMLRTIQQEHETLLRLVEELGAERVVSDHRYGCWHPGVPSYFLTHQLRFIAPGTLRPFEVVGGLFNARYHRRFERVLVPDLPDEEGGLLSGRLTRGHRGADRSRHVFTGPLSRLVPGEGGEEGGPLDLFVSISGPEPQRTILEHLVMQQIRSLPGRREVALGLPGGTGREEPEEGLVVHEYLDADAMLSRMRRARMVVCRSGYSTLMELAALGGKALLVPTPGQTEQLYLARRAARRGWVHTVQQAEMDLPRDLERARESGGIPIGYRPRESARRACEIILEGT